jgi:hypothetical protein
MQHPTAELVGCIAAVGVLGFLAFLGVICATLTEGRLHGHLALASLTLAGSMFVMALATLLIAVFE